MKTRACLFIFFLVAINKLHAQQPVFSMYTFDPLFYNPAYAGHDDGLTAGAHYRSQWAGIDGAPVTELVNAHLPIGFSGHSAGLTISSDKMAKNAATSATLNYAYRFQTKIGRISAGLDVSITHFTSGRTQLHAITPDDPALMADISLNIFNAGIGFIWENENGFAGISMPGVVENQLSEINNTDASRQPRQLNMIAQYQFPLGEKWKIAPSLLYTFIETEPSQLDLQMHFLFNDKMQFDIGYRNNSTYLAGFRLNVLHAFTLGYNYDYDGSAFGSASGGSHEICLGYHLQKKEGE